MPSQKDEGLTPEPLLSDKRLGPAAAPKGKSAAAAVQSGHPET
jgi:hypothetical protein